MVGHDETVLQSHNPGVCSTLRSIIGNTERGEADFI